AVEPGRGGTEAPLAGRGGGGRSGPPVPRKKDQPPGGCDVASHATNSPPSAVLVQTLRNLSRRLRGGPLISASIAAPPVTSAASPIMRTLRSVKLALLYLVLPEVIDPSQLALVSVTAEEWV